MKKLYGLLIVLFCFSIVAQGQDKSGKFGLQVETGYAFNLFVKKYPEYHHGAFNIAVSPGYHITDKLFAGVGLALYDYRYSNSSPTKYGGGIKINSSFISVPVYALGMWKFGASSTPSFFTSLKAGYGIISKSMNPIKGNDASYKIMRDYSGGLYLSPSLGYMFPINNIHTFSFSVSYDYQEYTIKSNANDKVRKDKKDNSTLALKLGWAF